MRVEYINPFVEAAYNVLKDVLKTDVRRGELFLKSTSTPVLGVAAILGLTGDVEGRVLYDMSEETAIAVASAMLGNMDLDTVDSLDDMAKATITELANMITGQAVTKLHNLSFQFDLTPPAIVTGENMEIRNTGVEALIVPIQLPMGKIEINVAVRERD